MAQDDEVLEAGRPGSRWVRRTVLIACSVLVAALVAGWWLRREDAEPPQTASTAPIAGADPATSVPAWPTATAGCGGQTELPIVSSSRRAGPHTGLLLLVGGSALHVIDFDSRKYRDIVSHWHHSLFVTALVPGYAVLGACGGATEPAVGVHRINADGSAPHPVALSAPMHTVLTDRSRAYGVAFPSDEDHAGALVPLGGGRPRALPSGFWPIGIAGAQMVGKGSATGNRPASLLMLDVSTLQVRANLGLGTALAVGHGVVVWSEDCSSNSQRPCVLHRRPVAGGATSSYRIPRPTGSSAGALSPDGRQLAFTIQRREPTPRHKPRHPGQPTDIAVLHFDTGVVEIVPGVELPPKTSPALAFSEDSQWLAIALDTGLDIRLLAWRSGLALPIESTPVAGPVQGAPALLVLSTH